MAYGIEEDYRQCQFELSITQTKVDQLEEENVKLQRENDKLKQLLKEAEETIKIIAKIVNSTTKT